MPRTPRDIPDSTLRLILAPGIGPATLRRLRQSLGDDDTIVEATERDLATVHGIGPATASAIRGAIADVDPDREADLMRARGARMILEGDADYPPLLGALDEAPPALRVLGSLTPEAPCLAVVGSRRCTMYGRQQAGRFTSLLAQCGLVVVSGGARGIDAEAHRAALRVGGTTVAVLGSGLGRPYPPEHEALFDSIVEQGGAVLSEHAMNVRPAPAFFPRRNRIISGLSVGVLVIEAGRRSGALITARLAAEQHGREVMVVPGRVDSRSSAGCLDALREGWAAPVRHHGDVLDQLELSGRLEALHARHGARAPGARARRVDLTGDQRAIVEVVRRSGGSATIDDIAAGTGLPSERVQAETAVLEIRRVMKKAGDGYAVGGE